MQIAGMPLILCILLVALRGFACDVLHEFFSNIFYKARCVKCMPMEVGVMNPHISIHMQCVSRAATGHRDAAAPPGNKRTVAPIGVSTVTRMEWQGIAAATSAASSLHGLAGAAVDRAQKNPAVLKAAATLGVWWCFTGMTMPSTNNTLSGWAEIQYSAAFTPPRWNCVLEHRDKKCLTAAVKITFRAVQNEEKCVIYLFYFIFKKKATSWCWLKQNLLKSLKQHKFSRMHFEKRLLSFSDDLTWSLKNYEIEASGKLA